MESLGQNRLSENQIHEIADRARLAVDIKDRRHRFHTYSQCFIGRELVKWFMVNGLAKTQLEATELGQKLVEQKLIEHVSEEQTEFQNEPLFYRFTVPDSKESLQPKIIENDSWHSVLPDLDNKAVKGVDFSEVIGDDKTDFHLKREGKNEMLDMLFDQHNCDLFDQVRPIKWTDPTQKVQQKNIIQPIIGYL